MSQIFKLKIYIAAVFLTQTLWLRNSMFQCYPVCYHHRPWPLHLLCLYKSCHFIRLTKYANLPKKLPRNYIFAIFNILPHFALLFQSSSTELVHTLAAQSTFPIIICWQNFAYTIFQVHTSSCLYKKGGNYSDL